MHPDGFDVVVRFEPQTSLRITMGHGLTMALHRQLQQLEFQVGGGRTALSNQDRLESLRHQG